MAIDQNMLPLYWTLWPEIWNCVLLKRKFLKLHIAQRWPYIDADAFHHKGNWAPRKLHNCSEVSYCSSLKRVALAALDLVLVRPIWSSGCWWQVVCTRTMVQSWSRPTKWPIWPTGLAHGAKANSTCPKMTINKATKKTCIASILVEYNYPLGTRLLLCSSSLVITQIILLGTPRKAFTFWSALAYCAMHLKKIQINRHWPLTQLTSHNLM